jgi:predicted RNA-binding protein with PIN domain
LVLAVIDDGLTEKEVTNSADDGIARLTRAEPRPHEIRVVTSDSTLTDRVRDAGATTYASASFRNLIDPLR